MYLRCKPPLLVLPPMLVLLPLPPLPLPPPPLPPLLPKSPPPSSAGSIGATSFCLILKRRDFQNLLRSQGKKTIKCLNIPEYY